MGARQLILFVPIIVEFGTPSLFLRWFAATKIYICRECSFYCCMKYASYKFKLQA